MTNDFDLGVGYAAAWLIKAHGEDGLALEMFSESGADLKKLDIYDRKIIQKAIRSDSRYSSNGHRKSRLKK